MALAYLDFEIEIGRGEGGREYPLAVKSRAGDARATMTFPYDSVALKNRLQSLENALSRSSGDLGKLPTRDEKAVQEFGSELFDALFIGEVRSRYDVALSSATQQGMGLRIKLRILSPQLAVLPWEYLFDKRHGEYVALSQETPLVRYLELPRPVKPLEVERPLRVLAMVASPTDLPKLNVEGEKLHVQGAIESLPPGTVELIWLEGGTWRDLQRAMRRGPWHILYFIGHGGFDPETDEGLLAFENEQGGANFLNASKVARLLADHQSLRLVLLNSCEGARASGLDVFSSTAANLVRHGIPAVLAMQYEITDVAAIEFARSFFEALADGTPVDAAVTEARKAMSIGIESTFEWGTPVLYMRASDGALFHLPQERQAADAAVTIAPDSRVLKIVPKGLRSFDAHDTDFFLDLLPGPRDRDGLPESIRFWKTRIEETDPDSTFTVGLIYGPSGCGKSSLVKAGLLPRLAAHVTCVYIEATPNDTETRLLHAIRKRCPGLDKTLGLEETLAALRRGHGLPHNKGGQRGVPAGQKILIVLDQFEQWLHANGSGEPRAESREPEESGESRAESGEPETPGSPLSTLVSPLVSALRQCDGTHVQCVVMVRDDFWMAVTRFMRALEVPLLERHNSDAVDLFDLDHAGKVLAAFGRAFGRLPEDAAEMTDDQRKFLDQAVQGLASDGKVICIRLALFAEMMKDKPWSPASLKEVGGTEGVGVTFLEETFSSSTAPPEHRFHQKAARAVLKALLPEAGMLTRSASEESQIKGHMRSREELLAASGYQRRPDEFDRLIHLLDHELRLITPTDNSGEPESEERRVESREPVEDCLSSGSRPSTLSSPRFYQLTHDYLVTALREWLTRKQKETRRGRAELRLAERAAAWNAKPESRHLPAWWEFLNIRLFTKKKNWTVSQRKMMRRASAYHALRAALVAVALVVLGVVGRETYGSVVARGLVEKLLAAQTQQVPGIVAELQAYRQWADPRLQAAFAEAVEGSSEKLHASLGLLPVDDAQADYLYDRLLAAEPGEVPVIRHMLNEYCSETRKTGLVQQLWSLWRGSNLPASGAGQPSDSSAGSRRLRAACALAVLDRDPARWREIAADVADQFVAVPSAFLGQWLATLREAREFLVSPLANVFQSAKRSAVERSMAAEILADYAADDAKTLVGLLTKADTEQFPVLFRVISQRHREEAVSLLEGELQPRVAAGAKTTEEEKDADAKRQATAAVALLRMGSGQRVWALLKQRPDPRLRSYLIHRFAPLEAKPDSLARQLGEEKDNSIRQALILSLGEFAPTTLRDSDREQLVSQLLQTYEDDPDPGIHGAADWLLRKWQHDQKVRALDEKLKEKADQRLARQTKSSRDWFVNSQGQTFAIIKGPVEFLRGSPEGEPNREPEETQHRVRLGYSFAVGVKEVTVTEYERFLKENADVIRFDTKRDAPESDCPHVGADWYDATAYCNWLSDKDGLSKDERCYEIKPGSENPVKLAHDYLKRRGYRLPAEAEWEYACRAESSTARYYGETDDLLGKYAWYLHNSGDRTQRVGLLKPNGLGLFDMHGNVWEWCTDSYDQNGDGEARAARGGGWDVRPRGCRASHRGFNPPENRNFNLGLRVVAVQMVK